MRTTEISFSMNLHALLDIKVVGSSRMRGNSHVRLQEGNSPVKGAPSLDYSCIFLRII